MPQSTLHKSKNDILPFELKENLLLLYEKTLVTERKLQSLAPNFSKNKLLLDDVNNEQNKDELGTKAQSAFSKFSFFY